MAKKPIVTIRETKNNVRVRYAHLKLKGYPEFNPALLGSLVAQQDIPTVGSLR